MRSSLQFCRAVNLSAAFVSAIWSPAAHAELWRYAFSGVIDQSDYGSVHIGDPFAGTFSYESGLADKNADPAVGLYLSSFDAGSQSFGIGLVYTVGSLSFDTPGGAGGGNVTVYDRQNGTDTFSLLLSARQDPLDPSSFRVGSVSFTDDTGDIFNTDALPASLSLDAFSKHRFTGTIGNVLILPQFPHFSGEISSLELNSIPEPCAILSAAIALIGMVCWPSRLRCRSPQCAVFTRLRAAIITAFTMIAVTLLSTPSKAVTFATYDFSGVITQSDSSLVDVGERFTGQFTFDRDAPDTLPDPDWGHYGYGHFPNLLPSTDPIGMTYSVASVSHSAKWTLSFDVFNNDAGEDDFTVSSDDFGFGSSSFVPPHTYGYLGLYDSSQQAFSSDSLPTDLNLQDFNETEFRGSDGTQKQCCFFEGIVDTLSLAPSAGLQGDFNHDGTVDAADYVLWRKNNGSPEDYDAWRANFGTAVAGSAAMARSETGSTAPEPGTLMLAGMALLGLARRIRRCRGAKAMGPAARWLVVMLIVLLAPEPVRAQLVTYEFAGMIDEKAEKKEKKKIKRCQERMALPVDMQEVTFTRPLRVRRDIRVAVSS